MKTVPAEQNSLVAPQEFNITRREWVKPSAKATEVNQATLAGGTNPDFLDGGSCSS